MKKRPQTETFQSARHAGTFPYHTTISRGAEKPNGRYRPKPKPFVLVMIAILCAAPITHGQELLFENRELPIEKRVDDLISRLSIEEKVSLLMHSNKAIERLGLPAYSWWNEALHGVGRNGIASVYPMPIGMAATFDPKLIESAFRNIVREAIAKHQADQAEGRRGDYTGLTFFTPNINIVRDPRWGRGMETYGEDPFLTSMMGMACVQGLQHGNGRTDQLTAAACLKHFAAHSGPEGTRHEFDAKAAHYDLFSTYLPAFEYIIRNSDVQQVMCAYNRLNGAPCCTNSWLLEELLRTEWQYDGIVVTDCWALNDCWETDTVTPRHRSHSTAALASAAAFGGAVDLECGSGATALMTAIDSGYLSESDLDRHLRRTLKTRLLVTDPSEPITERETTPYEVAVNSLVLLENNGILPLSTDKKVYLAGPNSKDTLMPLGNYNGTPRHTISIAEGLSTTYTLCEDIEDADVIVYAGGLSPQLEGEELKIERDGFYKGDRTTIELPQEQLSETATLKKSGKPIVMLLCTGSAIALENIRETFDAIMVCWYGGEAMGKATADALSGKANNFGNLPVTFYRSTTQLPDFDNYSMESRTYRYMKESPLYPFGYGLSYSRHRLDSMRYDPATHTVSGTLTLLGTERSEKHAPATIQVYLTHFDTTGHEQKRLIGMARIHTENSSRFTIKADPFWIRRYDPKSDRMVPITDPSEYRIAVGFNSRDLTTIYQPKPTSSQTTEK